MHTSTHQHSPWPALYRPAAVALGAATALAFAALAHHPVGRQVASAQESLAAMAALQTQAQGVHGVLIAMFALLAGAHAVFAHLLGVSRPAVLFALAAYAGGCVLMTGAMLLDGFVAPQLAFHFLAAPEAQALHVHTILAAIGVGIQVLAQAGLLAMSVAFITFAAVLATGRRMRGLVALALLAGVLPAGFVLFGGARLAPANLLAIFATHAAWHAGMAWALFMHRGSTRDTIVPHRSAVALP
jgi:hypothetical protein